MNKTGKYGIKSENLKHRHPEPIRQVQDKLRRRDWDPYRIRKVLKDLVHHIYYE